MRDRLETATRSHSRSQDHPVFTQYSFHLVYFLRQSPQSHCTMPLLLLCKVHHTTQQQFIVFKRGISERFPFSNMSNAATKLTVSVRTVPTCSLRCILFAATIYFSFLSIHSLILSTFSLISEKHVAVKRTGKLCHNWALFDSFIHLWDQNNFREPDSRHSVETDKIRFILTDGSKCCNYRSP